MRWYLIAAVLLGGCYDDPIQISPYELTTASEELERRQRERDEPIPERCGNGEVDSGEQCDDGNRIDNDECSNHCIERRVEVPRGVPWSTPSLARAALTETSAGA